MNGMHVTVNFSLAFLYYRHKKYIVIIQKHAGTKFQGNNYKTFAKHNS